MHSINLNSKGKMYFISFRQLLQSFQVHCGQIVTRFNRIKYLLTILKNGMGEKNADDLLKFNLPLNKKKTASSINEIYVRAEIYSSLVYLFYVLVNKNDSISSKCILGKVMWKKKFI